MRPGISQTDITPTESVWLTGYGNRDHRSEGVYQALRAGAVYLEEGDEASLVLTADLIGFGPAYAAMAKSELSMDTGLLPRQIVLTATHTHCAPFFSPWIMPGADTYDLGGYEVASSYTYFGRPAPFTRDAESLILATTRELVQGIA